MQWEAFCFRTDFPLCIERSYQKVRLLCAIVDEQYVHRIRCTSAFSWNHHHWPSLCSLSIAKHFFTYPCPHDFPYDGIPPTACSTHSVLISM